jgi:hypothetical protein
MPISGSAMIFSTSGFSREQFPVSSVCRYRISMVIFFSFIEDSGGQFYFAGVNVTGKPFVTGISAQRLTVFRHCR